MKSLSTSNIKTQFRKARQLVIIDSKVENYQTLVNGLATNIPVFILNPHEDGIKQISQILARHNFDLQLHIVSHGSPGCLYLGNISLSLDTVNFYAEELKSWFSKSCTPSLSHFPTLYLYGCNVAAGDAGEEFLTKLHSLIGVEIAASTTKVGNSSLGGNWDLDAIASSNCKNHQPPNYNPFSPEAITSYPDVLILSPEIDLSGTVQLTFPNNPTQEDGSTGANAGNGQVVRYSNVGTTPSGTAIDMIATVVSHAGDGVTFEGGQGTGNDFRTSLFIDPGSSAGEELTATVRYDFVVSGTDTPIEVPQFEFTLQDFDEIGSLNEKAEITNFSSYTVSENTSVGINPLNPSFGDNVSFTGTEDNAPTDPDAAVQVSFNTISSFEVTYTTTLLQDTGNFSSGYVHNGDGTFNFGANPVTTILDNSVFNYSDLFTEGDPPINIADPTGADVDDFLENDLQELEIVVSNATDAGSEIVNIGGTDFPLDTDATQTLTIGSTSVNINYVAATGTFTITESGGGTLPEGDLDTLIQGITYNNTSTDPTEGDRTFNFTATDLNGNANIPPSISTITVDAVNPPAANDDNPVASTGSPFTFNPLDNDTDSDGTLDPTTVELIDPTGNPVTNLTVPGEGTWEVNPTTGEITFTPEANFTGDPTAVEYTVADSDGNTSNPATITLDYQDGPAANDDNPVASTGSPFTFNPLDNDTDSDGTLDPTTVELIDPTGNPVTTLTVPGEGTWEVNPTTGEITFTPEANFTGDPTAVEYTVADSDGNTSNPATITLDYQDDTTDTDNDGVPDAEDLDDDNDGIPDEIEGDGDTDGDGVPDIVDLDSDNDGISDLDESGLPPEVIADLDSNNDGVIDPDNDFGDNGLVDDVETTPDSGELDEEVGDNDGDNVPDFQDLDSDNDGIDDILEAGLDDPEGDGVVNGGDSDGDGVLDPVDATDGFGDENPEEPDTDGDNVPDFRDLDSDNDGINDIIEAGVDDPDGDGVVDGDDTDGDGIPDVVDDNPSSFGDGTIDTDNDGVPDAEDLDDDNDGIPDEIEGDGDTDGDGVPDIVDLDSDNDGISDLDESGLPPEVIAELDSNNDGVIDPENDFGDNGLVDDVETTPDSGELDEEVGDTDGDNVPDFQDLDSDNDGINDVTEAGLDDLDDNGDGVVDGGDSDGDGVLDPVDATDGFGDENPEEPDTDGDNVPDFQDLDSDNDGINDIIEAGVDDPDGDGVVDGNDTDGDGIPDVVDDNPSSFGDDQTEPEPDTDNDGVPDYQDLDSDNDGVNDIIEAGLDDPDGDGVVDSGDIDNDGIPDVVDENDGFGDEASDPIPDSDNDGTPDYQELDSDNDGTDDIIEAGLDDPEGDGIVNGGDGDGDGIVDSVDENPDTFGDNPTDTDGDGVLDVDDLDDDNDGIPDEVEGDGDTDGDGIPDIVDLDSDNDGISDLDESGLPPEVIADLDSNNDGVIDPENDFGDNGLVDDVETTPDSGELDEEVVDTDGDNVPDFQDLDSDNDGINDVTEAGLDDLDNNGDGVIDGGDSDGDGVPDGVDATDGFGDENPEEPDTDSDGTPDFQDLDSDNDGINDVTEAGLDDLDDNGDGVIDGGDTDDDGIPDILDENPDTNEIPDTDNDGTPDFQDLDSDNDGTDDIIEAGLDDPEGDGVVNGGDTDGDGIPDTVDDNPDGFGDNPTDTDNDGVPDTVDLDDDNDGIPDEIEGNGDTDGDDIPDSLDLDSDNDGISDLDESGLPPEVIADLDSNNDGVIDPDNDFGDNGLVDEVETTPDSGELDEEVIDTDGDNVPDFQDLDSDNDGINDITEAGIDDPEGDGVVNGEDEDGDGVLDPVDATDGFGDENPEEPDTDSDGVPDFQDLDSDNDGTNDIIEAGLDDPDGNGVVDGEDEDGDGVLDPVDLDPDGFGDDQTEEVPDTDNDGTPDFQDLDSDNDGVNDITEAGLDDLDENNDGVVDGEDTDGDGVLDPVDLDPDSFGDDESNPDNEVPDTDGDGVPDFRDLDSDNDGVNDVTEAGLDDNNGDGVVDGGDSDGDGVLDSVDGSDGFGDDGEEEAPDTDGDGTPDFQDLDSDNDGTNDIEEAGIEDEDGDGVVDGGDSDGDGIPDAVDTNPDGFGDNPTDTDGDGIFDVVDLDDDNDGIPDEVEGNGDTDGDGVPDSLDLDSDNDGISDLDESGLPPEVIADLDTNNDGVIDSDQPFGDNGLVDEVETTPDSGELDEEVGDTDGDNVPDFQDLDSDNDGINDITEAGIDDPEGDGVVNGGDTDGDGVLDPIDASDGFGDVSPEEPDTDGDNVPDFRDLDSDNDGINDIIEAGIDDPEGDGILNGGDADGDGILDSVDESDGFGNDGQPDALDTDGDDVPDYRDLDSDNDGINDIIEAGVDDPEGDGILNGGDADGDGVLDSVDESDGFGDDGQPDAPDTDEDGIPDYQDLDSDDDGINDITEAGLDDPEGDGVLNGEDSDGDGVLDSVDSNPNGFGDESAQEDLLPDEDNDGIPDFQDQVISSISGTLFVDSNEDGALNDGDTAVNAGVEIRLLDTAGNVVATTATNDNGQYFFGTVPEGQYVVSVRDNDPDLPGDFALTTPNEVFVNVDETPVSGLNFGFEQVCVAEGVHDVFGISTTTPDATTQLKINLLEVQAGFNNEVGIFFTDDEYGTVNGIAPGEEGYLEAALNTGQTIFSAISQNADLFHQDPVRIIEGLEDGTNFSFYLVQHSTTDAVLANLAAGQETAEVFFGELGANADGFEHLNVTDVGNGSFLVDWEDTTGGGDLDYDDINLLISLTDETPTLGNTHQGGTQRELLDLTSAIAQSVAAQFFIGGDSGFSNRGGLYIVADESGAVIDPLTGDLVNPSDGNYAQVALANSAVEFADTDLHLTTTLNGGFLYAPYILADGETPYFPFIEANSDGFDHTRLLGDNIFGFEDLPNSGDQSYDDFFFEVYFPELNTQLVDLTDVNGSITAQISSSGHSDLANLGGLYQVLDESGAVVDPNTGAILNPGDGGYANAALAASVAEFDENTTNLDVALDGGSFYAPYILADGDTPFFPFIAANSDGLNHMRYLGDLTFSFEDLVDGGDFSHNDFSFNVNLPPEVTQTTATLVHHGTTNCNLVTEETNIITLQGDQDEVNLQFTLTESNAGFVNEVGVFLVDDANGNLNGLNPGDPGYLQAALESGSVIFSALSETNNLFGEAHNRIIPGFSSGQQLGFFLIQDSTVDKVLADLAAGRDTGHVFFGHLEANSDGSEHTNVSAVGNSGYHISWEDHFTGEGDADFNDLGLYVSITEESGPIGNALQGGNQLEVFDLRPHANQQLQATFQVTSDANFSNRVGFYLADESGNFVDSVTGETFTVGDDGYAQAAVNNSIFEVDHNNFESVVIDGGQVLTPYLIVDDGEIFLPFIEANSDGVDHVRLLGDNMFGFEDQVGGGDFDYDDIIIAVDFNLTIT